MCSVELPEEGRVEAENPSELPLEEAVEDSFRA
jgi:hypothetical protein